MKFPESKHAHQLLDGLIGIEIGGSAHNQFGLNTINVDYTDDMDTIFKQQEVDMCGEALPVDMVAPGDVLPMADKSVDFVISSHVIEHFFDPIKAIKEWQRVARKYVYIIAPQPCALPSDCGRPLTTNEDFEARHSGRIKPPTTDTHEHYSVWSCLSFLEMCDHFGFKVVDNMLYDDKVGNGFTIVIEP
jgi:SAM-dependent methyltransferase